MNIRNFIEFWVYLSQIQMIRSHFCLINTILDREFDMVKVTLFCPGIPLIGH